MSKKAGKLNKRFDGVIIFVYIVMLIYIAYLIIHLFSIQIIDTPKYRAKAKAQRVTNSFTLRGDIYDRNGLKLATDETYYEVYAHKRKSSAKNQDGFSHSPMEMSQRLAPILNMSQQEIYNKLVNNKPGIITLKRNISKDTKKRIDEIGWMQDLSVGKKSQRIYPQGNMAAHVLGYYNMNTGVATGIEDTQKDKLENIKQLIKFEHTRDGKVIYNFLTDPVAPTTKPKGEDVTLTIDAAIQHVAERELFKMARERHADHGVAIVMNPKNGEILAYAVYPESKTSADWSLTGVYSPGSTFKAITVASALELGKITEYDKVYYTCSTKIGKDTIKDPHCYPEGMITLAQLFERSSNVASYAIARKMTSREFYEMIRKFGFGQKTGIEIKRPKDEPQGLLSPPSQWYGEISKANMAFGYGTSVTAIQMASAWSALANDGVRVTPHVIKYTPEEELKKIKYVRVISPETAKIVTRALVQNIDMGKTTFKLDKYKLAAKTGTSNHTFEGKRGFDKSKSYASTIGYLPASDPQVLIYVCIDNAKGGEVWGNTIAGPVFKEIAEQVARIMNLKPDKK